MIAPSPACIVRARELELISILCPCSLFLIILPGHKSMGNILYLSKRRCVPRLLYLAKKTIELDTHPSASFPSAAPAAPPFSAAFSFLSLDAQPPILVVSYNNIAAASNSGYCGSSSNKHYTIRVLTGKIWRQVRTRQFKLDDCPKIFNFIVRR